MLPSKCDRLPVDFMLFANSAIQNHKRIWSRHGKNGSDRTLDKDGHVLKKVSQLQHMTRITDEDLMP